MATFALGLLAVCGRGGESSKHSLRGSEESDRRGSPPNLKLCHWGSGWSRFGRTPVE